MGAGNYTKVVTVLTGQTITASERNNEHDNHITNHNFETIDDYAANAAQFAETKDPYPAAVVSLPTQGDEELQVLRYQFLELHKRMAPGASETLFYKDFPYIWGSKGADVASAAALALGSDGNYFDITGTTTITSIGTKGVGSLVILRFTGALVLTHHSSDLVLPGATNITTATGDVGHFLEYASGDWVCIGFSKLSLHAGAQTIAGIKTFSSGIVMGADPGGTPTAHTLYKVNVIKGWANMNGSGTPALNDSFNVSGIVDNAAGDYTITWDLDFANNTYAVAGAANYTGHFTINNTGALAVGSTRIFTEDVGGAAAETNNICVIAVGDQT